MKFYLAREGVAFGPYTEFQVRESVRIGIFERNDLALPEDGKEWLEVSELLPPETTGAVEPAKERPAWAWLSASVAWGLSQRPAVYAVAAAAALCCLFGVYATHRHPLSSKQTAVGTESSRPRAVASAETNPSTRSVQPAPSSVVTAAAAITTPPLVTVDLAEDPLPAETAPAIADALDANPATTSRQIEGQIFISTKSGMNYEPSSVEVRLYPLALLKPHLEKRSSEASIKFEEMKAEIKAAEANKERLRKAADVAFDAYAQAAPGAPNRRALEQANIEAKRAREKGANAYYNLMQDREDVLSGAYYLEDLPKPADVTRTDRQGRFHFEVPVDGEFAVVAGAQRNLSDSTEHYYWFVPVSIEGEPKKTVLLSNNNVSSHGSVDSLVQTAD